MVYHRADNKYPKANLNVRVGKLFLEILHPAIDVQLSSSKADIIPPKPATCGAMWCEIGDF